MRRVVSLLLVLALATGLFTACGSSASSKAAPTATPDPTATPEPTPVPLNPNPLTGLEKAADYSNGKRPVAVMVNNIKSSSGNDAFPQWGIGDADLLYEIVTEGGITRLMAVFSDYTKMPTVGPVRSARDQHVQLMMPYQALYVHEGASIFAARLMREPVAKYGLYSYDPNDYSTYDYTATDLYNAGPFGTVVKWDQQRMASRSQEMCAYTSGELVANAVAKGADDNFEPSPIFNFVRYDEPARELTGNTANEMHFQYSSSYYSGFSYDAASGTYLKTNTKGGPHIDGNTGKQLGFTNVLLLFADIKPYSQLGYDAGMLTHVEYSWGGVGYYFCGGKMEPIRWLKGLPTDPLRIVDNQGNEIDVEINCGKTYIGFSDYGMYDYCTVDGRSMNAEIEEAPTVDENLSNDNQEAAD